MLHPFLNPHISSLPSRAVYKHGPSDGGASGSQAAMRMESISDLPATGTPEELRLRLAALEGQVGQEERRSQLEGLKGKMELQQEAQQQENREVNFVLNKLGGSLEDAPERLQVMNSIQNRLTLELAVLVEDGEITEAQLAPTALEATLQRLNQGKGSIKVKSADGERNLYTHEQNMLTVPALLKNHANEDVKKAWESMSRSMQQNVQIMRATANTISGGTAGRSLPARASAATKGLYENVVSTWKSSSNTKRALMVAGAAAGVGLLFMLGKKLFGSSERSSSGSSTGMILGLLGIGGLVAGGVYLYNRLKSPLDAFNSLKDLIPGMTRVQFQTGLAAHMAGNETAARAAWGEHYDVLAGRLSGTSGISQRAATLRSNIDTEKNRKDAKFAATTSSLITFFHLSERDVGTNDRAQIKQIFNAFRGRQTSVIVQLWEANKNNGTKEIANNNAVLNLDTRIKPKNIYRAAEIIGKTYEVYSRRFNINSSENLTLGDFIGRVSSDPVHEAGQSIHESLMAAVNKGTISLVEGLSMEKLTSFFDREREEHTERVCEKLGVNIKSLTQREKIDFYAITLEFYRSGTLDMSVQQALQNANASSRSSVAAAKAGEFYTKTKQRTLQVVLPGVIRKFNITNTENAKNDNILQNHLTEQSLLFRDAFKLNVVSANFSFTENESVSEVEELTLLFVALGGLPTQQKNRYYSELAKIFVNADSNVSFPSLEKLRPYFGKIRELIVKSAEHKVEALGELLSAFTGDRNDAQQEVFRERVRNADGAEFVALGLQEGARGGIMFTGDLVRTLVEMGASFEDLNNGKDALDFVMRLGGALIIGKNNDGKSTGMLYMAGKYFLVKPLQIGWDSILAGWNGQDGDSTLWGRTKAVAKTYTVGAAPYIVIGGAVGFATGGWKGLAAGAARGLAAPISMPVRGAQAAMNTFEMGRQAFSRGSLANLVRNSEMLDLYRGKLPKNLSGSEWFSRQGVTQVKNRVLLNDWNKARHDVFMDNFRRSYNKLFGFGDSEGLISRAGQEAQFLDEVLAAQNRVKGFTNALAGSEEFTKLTNADELKALITRLGEVDGLLSGDETAKLLSKVDSLGFEKIKGLFQGGVEVIGRQSKFARARGAFNTAIRNTGLWWSNRGVDLTTESMRASAETLDGIRRGANISGDSLAVLKNTPHEELMPMLRAMVETDEAANRLSAAIRRGSFDDIAVAMRETNFLLETAEEGSGVLRRALDTLGSGAELGMQKLGAIKQALSSAPDSAAYKAVASKLDSLAGMTANTKNTIISAFKAHATVENLKTALGAAGEVFIKIKEGVSGTIRYGVELAGEVAARLGSALSKLRGKLPLGAVDIVALRNALMNPRTEGYRMVKEAFEGMYHFGRHHVIRLEQILTTPRNFPGGRQLKDMIESTGIWKVADEVAQMDDVIRAGSEGLQSTRGLSKVFENMKGKVPLGADDLNVLMEAAKHDDFADALRRSGVATEHADEIVDALKNQKNLSRLQDTLEATGALKFGDEITGLAKIGRALGPIAMMLGAGFNAFDAYSRHQMAQAFKDNPEAYKYMVAQSYVVGASAVLELGIDIGTMGMNAAAYGRAGSYIGRGATFLTGSATLGSIMATLGPQIIIAAGIESMKYMIVGALDARAEVARTDEDWKNEAIRKGFASSGVRLSEGEAPNEFQTERITTEAVNILLHELMVTTVETNAGEAYDSVFTSNTIKGYGIEKGNTRLKIVDALVTLLTPGKTQEYKQYFFNYFASKTNSLNIASFQQGKQFIAQATMFADFMQKNRERTLIFKTGVNTQESLQLNQDRFNANQITAADIIKIRTSIGVEANNILRASLGDSLYNRFNGLDKNYLNYSMSVMAAYLVAHPDRAQSERSQRMQKFLLEVYPVLQFSGYQVKLDTSILYPDEEIGDIEKALFEVDLSKDELVASLGPYQAATPAIAAFYVLASAYGYQGAPNFGQLQLFFSAAKKERFGIYWDGDEWNVNENNGDDDGTSWILADSPDDAIKQIISAFKNPDDDTIVSRNASAVDFRERDHQTKAMNMLKALGNTMQSAYDNHTQTLPSRPAEVYENRSATRTFVQSMFTADTWKESMGETADTISEGVSTAVTSTREAIGSVISSGGNAISSLGSTIGGWFSSDDDDE